MGVYPRFALLYSAPLSGIEVLAGIITGVCRKEVVSILQGKQRNVAALAFGVLRGKKCHSQRVLVIIRNEPSLDGVAHSLPPLVVLIVDVTAFNAGMLVDHEQGTGIKRQFLSARFIPIQQAANGIAQPVGRLIPAVRQQRMERDVEPAVSSSS